MHPTKSGKLPHYLMGTRKGEVARVVVCVAEYGGGSGWTFYMNAIHARQ